MVSLSRFQDLLRHSFHKFAGHMTALTLAATVVGSVSAEDLQGRPELFTPAATVDSTRSDATGSCDTEEFSIEKHLESFDIVWDTIRTKHFDPSLGGLDWDAVRTELRPKVEQAKDAETVREVLGDMLGRLKQSHLGIIPREIYEETAAGRNDVSGQSGCSIRLIDSQLVISGVKAGSPAEQAGLKPGWIVSSIAGKQAGEIIEKVRKLSEHETAKVETLIGLTAERLTSGSPDETVVLVAGETAEGGKEYQIKLAAGSGAIAKFGELPPLYVEVNRKMIEHGDGDSRRSVSYVAFNCFFEPAMVMPEFQKAVLAGQNADGLVVDLRGNRGGIAAMVTGMSRWFVSKPCEMGTIVFRNGPNPMKLTPREVTVSKPVAVLIDECSISSAEMLAAALQDLGGARVFGTASAGLVLPSTVIELPNGDRFQYVLSNYLRASGGSLEGPGVQPDETIPMTLENLRSSSDPVLGAALNWIQSSSAAGK